MFGLKLKNKFNFPKTKNNRYEVFIKRKNKKHTYNIGCIDGTGCIKIKKRLKDFFNDCPNLVQMIKKNKINNTHKFYKGILSQPVIIYFEPLVII